MKKAFFIVLIGLMLCSCSFFSKTRDQTKPATGEQIIPVSGKAQSTPGGRLWASMVFHPKMKQIILFGGGRLSDMWALDSGATQWHELYPAGRPNLARTGGAIGAYDSRADQLIVFFYTGANIPGETWAYDFKKDAWRDLNPANAPTGRRLTSLVYDSESDKIILFGGVTGDDATDTTDETWVFDYSTNTWTKMNPAVSPQPAYFVQTAYDPTSDRVILWGGLPASTENAIWFYDYNSDAWQKESYQAGPRPDGDGSMVYSERLHLIYLYVRDQFWSYDPGNHRWKKLNGGPGRRYGISIGYDEAAQRVVLFGGAGYETDTWVYDPAKGKWLVFE
jgi:N-acetylneuraminic acid mutarotase